MDNLDRVPDKDASIGDGYEHFQGQIKRIYKEAMDFISGTKLFGVEIDLTQLEEVIAALYTAYLFKELLTKDMANVQPSKEFQDNFGKG